MNLTTRANDMLRTASWRSMSRRAILCVAGLCLLLAGCGGGLEKLPTAQVTGTVLCNGSPVDSALVYIEPLGSGSGPAGKQGYALTDSQGRFTISTYGENDGAVVGRSRIRVGPPARSGWQCDCETNEEVDVMQVEVVEGENDFEVVLPKKSKSRRGTSNQGDDDDEDD